MKIKIIKNLILFSLVAVIFVLSANNAFASRCSSGYCNYYNAYSSDNDYYGYNTPSYGYNSSSSYSAGNNSSSGYSSSDSSNKPATVINNYYYGSQNDSTKSNTTTTTNNKNTSTTESNTSNDNESSSISDSDNIDSSKNNLLGASAYSGITALSLKGSGGFMPSSIWQWILTFFLILVVVILARVVFHRNPKTQTH